MPTNKFFAVSISWRTPSFLNKRFVDLIKQTAEGAGLSAACFDANIVRPMSLRFCLGSLPELIQLARELVSKMEEWQNAHIR